MGKKSVKKKMGRPPKQGEKKDGRLIVAVEPSRKRLYADTAKREGLDLAAWVRLQLDNAVGPE